MNEEGAALVIQHRLIEHYRMARLLIQELQHPDEGVILAAHDELVNEIRKLDPKGRNDQPETRWNGHCYV
jgi:hypothetical protein